MYGARVSLMVGLAATVIAIVIGSVVGIVAGHYSGSFGGVLMRVTEWFLVIPFLPLAIVLATILGASIVNIIIVIGITSWPGTARLVRAQVLTLKERPYVERSRAFGAGSGHLMGRHILPNVSPLILANLTLTVPIAILSETTLAFLGLGDPLRPSWGKMLDDAFTSGALTRNAWWYYLPPGLCILFVVLSFVLIGQALEEILDPRLKGRDGRERATALRTRPCRHLSGRRPRGARRLVRPRGRRDARSRRRVRVRQVDDRGGASAPAPA